MVERYKNLLRTMLILTIIIMIAPFFIFPFMNNIKAKRLANELLCSKLPDQTEIIEVLSGCGNVSGTGNSTRIWAGMLIKTRLPDIDVFEFYKKTRAGVQKADSREKDTLTMGNLGKTFLHLSDINEFDGYYIVEWVDDAVSSYFDLRGH